MCRSALTISQSRATLWPSRQPGQLRRNFQGYTDDACETIVGLGPSAISSYAQGYCQNITSTIAYERVALEGELTTARGVAVSADDLARRWVIERLMCDFGFSATQALSKHGKAAEPILADAQRFARRAAMPSSSAATGSWSAKRAVPSCAASPPISMHICMPVQRATRRRSEASKRNVNDSGGL